MSQQTIGVGVVPNDGTGDQPRTAFTKVNANFSELYGAATTAPLGILYVDPFGAKGDGTTDDTAAINLAEAARTAGQVLKFTPGKTYAVAQTVAANLLKVLVSGTWDFRGATIKYAGSTTLAGGSDGGALGVINVLANNTIIMGDVDGNTKARYAVAWKSQTAKHQIYLGFSNKIEDAGSNWCGVSGSCSADVTGVAISGRATNISGILQRPSCPFIANSSDTVITGHGDVTALLVGGSLIPGNQTSQALVLGGGQYNFYFAILDELGIMTTAKIHEGNTHWGDAVVHDLGANVLELYGHGIFGTNFGLDGTTPWPAAICKAGTVIGGWWDTPDTSTTNPPNWRLQGMSRGANLAAQQAYGYLAGQWQLGNQKPSATASYAPDLSAGNDFVIPASGAALTVGAPTNPPVNPSGLLLTQIFSVTIQRLSGGALTTTWNAAYHLAGAWTDPSGANTQRSIWFRYDIGAAVAYEISRSAADVTV